MNYSGVLVSAFPGRYDEMLRELDTIEGVEVHQQDPDHNRCIIVIEAPDVTAEVDLFKPFQLFLVLPMRLLLFTTLRTMQ